MGVLKRNVFLVGFMGVGKTTVARRMARDMGVACVDLDAYLARKHGKSAAELYGELGEETLRDMEAEALAECAGRGPSVISCGEGIVASEKSREILKRQGFAVMLESTEEASLGRIHNLSTRPLLAHDCDIEGLWEQRKPLYEEVARAKIDVNRRSTASTAGFIAKVLVRAGVYEPEEEDAVAAKCAADVEKKRQQKSRRAAAHAAKKHVHKHEAAKPAAGDAQAVGSDAQVQAQAQAATEAATEATPSSTGPSNQKKTANKGNANTIPNKTNGKRRRRRRHKSGKKEGSSHGKR